MPIGPLIPAYTKTQKKLCMLICVVTLVGKAMNTRNPETQKYEYKSDLHGLVNVVCAYREQLSSCCDRFGQGIGNQKKVRGTKALQIGNGGFEWDTHNCALNEQGGRIYEMSKFMGKF